MLLHCSAQICRTPAELRETFGISENHVTHIITTGDIYRELALFLEIIKLYIYILILILKV